MLKTVIIINILFYPVAGVAQHGFREFIDSTIGRDHFSDSDWAIGLETSPAYMPMYDSLGNQLPELERGWDIIILKIRGELYFQKFRETCYDSYKCYYVSKRVRLPETVLLNYTADSIQQAEKEFIYPYIYKDDSLDVYYRQEAGSHAPRYCLLLYSKTLAAARCFDDVDIMEKLEILSVSFHIPVNLNFRYNASTFIYRSFLRLRELFNEQRELLLRLH